MTVHSEDEEFDHSELAEERLEEKEVFSGNLLRVTINQVKDAEGNIAGREVVHHPGGVVIAPLIRGTEFHEIVLVKQYREPAEETLWELPAGTLEEGETREECSQRELMEETGYRAGKLEKKVDLYTSPGYSDEVLSLYVASDLEKLEAPDKMETPDDENLIIGEFSLQEAVNMAKNGEIRDGKTLAGMIFLL